MNLRRVIAAQSRASGVRHPPPYFRSARITDTQPAHHQPITGREDLHDLSDPKQALAQFYRAFNSRDLALMAANWEDSDEVAMDNPLGGIKRGWPEIRAVYDWRRR